MWVSVVCGVNVDVVMCMLLVCGLIIEVGIDVDIGVVMFVIIEFFLECLGLMLLLELFDIVLLFFDVDIIDDLSEFLDSELCFIKFIGELVFE